MTISVPFSALPPEARRAIPGEAKRPRSSSRVTAWKDVPGSWGQCREHGLAFFPRNLNCLFCEVKRG